MVHPRADAERSIIKMESSLVVVKLPRKVLYFGTMAASQNTLTSNLGNLIDLFDLPNIFVAGDIEYESS